MNKVFQDIPIFWNSVFKILKWDFLEQYLPIINFFNDFNSGIQYLMEVKK